MNAEWGGLNLPLLEELVAAGAESAVLREEGYTEAETIRSRIASALRTTSDAVSIGPAVPANRSGTTDRQPRRGVSAGTTSSGPAGALERGPGTAVAPRGGNAGHSHAKTRSRPD
jgi:hypothetical protein